VCAHIVGCAKSVLDSQVFRVLGDEVYLKYTRFSALNYEADNQVQWCPQPNCGLGFLPPDPSANNLLCNACLVCNLSIHHDFYHALCVFISSRVRVNHNSVNFVVCARKHRIMVNVDLSTLLNYLLANGNTN
jgi:hypothetical protein